MEPLEGRCVLAALTPGNLAIYRVGNGVETLANTGNTVFVDEYTPAGSFVQSIQLPNSGVDSLVANGTSTSEGGLSLSADGNFLLLTGYGPTAIPAVSSLQATASTAVSRVVGRIDGSGTIDTSTRLTDFASGSSPRSAASTDGTDLWVAGGTGGGRYTTLGSTTSTQLASTPTNLRHLNIANGQLYVSSQSGSTRLATVGTGMPTTAGQTITNLPGANISSLTSPYGSFFADLDAGVAGVDTLYVADDGTSGLQKFSLVAGAWVSNGLIGVDADDYRGVTGIVSGTTVSLFATRKGGGATAGGELVTLVDASGYNGAFAGTPTLLASASASTSFRGITRTPAGITNRPPTLDMISDRSISEDSGQQTVSLTGITAGSGESQPLRLTATSSNTQLISNPTVTYTSPNSTGLISFAPIADRFGAAKITVTVEDGGIDGNIATVADNAYFSRSFTVTINEVNDLPSLSPIDALSFAVNAGLQTVNLSGITAGAAEAQPVRVTATSSNPGLIPNPVVGYNDARLTNGLQYPAGNQTYGTQTGDFNSDGITDVAVVHLLGGNVSVYYGNGNGTFQPPVFWGMNSNSYSLVVKDFDGDGRDDMVVTNFESNLVSVRTSTGNGFSAIKTFATGNGAVFPASTGVDPIQAGDFNNDGKLDIVVGNTRHHFLSILLGDGAGNFSAPIKSDVDPSGSLPRPSQIGPRSLSVADFNRDGKLDVAVGLLGKWEPGMDIPGDLRIMVGDGNGNLSLLYEYETGQYSYSVYSDDFNSDGIADLAISSVSNVGSNPYRIVVLQGDGLGAFSSAQTLNPITENSNPGGISSGDFNRDGFVDLLAFGSSLDLYLGNGVGLFTGPVSVSNPAGSNRGGVVTDFNRDGWLDVAWGTGAGTATGTLSTWTGRDNSIGSLTFTPISYQTGTATITVNVEDGGIDGDLATVADNAIFSRSFHVTVGPPNNPPTISLSNIVSTLQENGSSPESIRVANINLVDDAQGTNILSLSGADSGSFQLVYGAEGPQLHLIPDAILNYETKPYLEVVVNVDDATIGSSPDSSVNFRLELTNIPETVIVDRRVFYHRSLSAVFGNGSGNPNSAIDFTKSALLPGGQPTFANYTNYVKGLNGLVIDATQLPAKVTASDFAFAIWNGIDAAGFVAVAATPTITFLPGGGVFGAERVKIEFPDDAIRNNWLRVTMLANANTDLLFNDVFYFGNAVADFDVGNIGEPKMIRTNASDTSAVRMSQSPTINSAIISNIFDINKDGRVNSTDTSLVRQHQSGSLIRFFTAPASLQLALASEETDTVMADTTWLEELDASSSRRRRSRML